MHTNCSLLNVNFISKSSNYNLQLWHLADALNPERPYRHKQKKKYNIKDHFHTYCLVELTIDYTGNNLLRQVIHHMHINS